MHRVSKWMLIGLMIIIPLWIAAVSTEIISDQVVLDTVDPTVSVTYPNGGETLYIGSEHEITWTAGDFSFPDGCVTVEYSADNGSNWLAIEQSLDFDDSCWWNPPTAPGEQYLIRVTATDQFGNQTSDQSDATFALEFDPAIYIFVPDDYTTVQEAIDAATFHQIIIVREGTYRENIHIEGKEIILASEYYIDQNESHVSNTEISGEYRPGDPSWDEDEASTLKITSGSNPNAVPQVVGLSLINGAGRLYNGKKVGGNIFIEGLNAILQGNEVKDNTAVDEGGGAYALNAKPNFGGEIEDAGQWGMTRSINPGNNHFEGNWAVFGKTIYADMTNSTETIHADSCHFDVYNTALQEVSSYWAFTDGQFTFAGGSGDFEAIYGGDIYVETWGSDVNVGNTTGDPVKSIETALGRIYPTVGNPVTVHVGSGAFNSSETSEKFPFQMLDHTTIQGSGEDETYIQGTGSGRVLYINESTDVQIRDLNISNGNLSSGNGGAIYMEDSEVRLEAVNFVYNHANSGGAICALNTGLTLTDCEFLANEATSEFGGAILFNDTSSFIDYPLTIDGCLFQANECSTNGAALYITWANQVEITGSTFTDNSCQNLYSSFGGGIYLSNCDNAVIEQSGFSENSANIGGGLYMTNCDDFIADRNHFHENDTNIKHGGAIYIYGSTGAVINNLFNDNVVTQNGAAIYASGSGGSIVNNTFTGNSATISGDAIYLSASSPDIYNNIFWGNGGSRDGDQIYLRNNSQPVIAYSDVQGGQSGVGVYSGQTYDFNAMFLYNIDLDPLFTGSGNHPFQLQDSSPCINIADSTAFDSGEFPLDLAGNPRIETLLDMGAYENQTVTWIAKNAGNHEGVWQNMGADYKVFGDITIPDTKILSIEPGVNVIIQGHYRIQVDGCLLAQGASEQMITFTADDTETGWMGIRFDSVDPANPVSVLDNCILEHGSANGTANSDNYGGAIYCSNSPNVRIDHSVIRNNRAAHYGGGCYFYHSDVSIQSTIVTDNTCDAHGGGLYFYESSPTVISCSIYNNITQNQCGGVYFTNSSATLINTDILDNTAVSGPGGGILCFDDSDPNLINCIISGNTAASSNNQVHLWNTIDDPSFTNCAVVGGTSGFTGDGAGSFTGDYIDCIDSDPAFLGTGDYPYQLSGPSPCINAGIADTTGLSLPEYDLAGNQRVMYDRVDIGAYEYVSVPPVVSSQIPDQVMQEDHQILSGFDLDDYFNDPNQDVLTYVASGYEHLTVTIDAQNLVTIEPEADWCGVQHVIINAGDGYDRNTLRRRGTAIDTFMVTVTPVNDAPVVIDPLDPIVLSENGQTSFQIFDVFNDVDLIYGDNLSVSWQGNTHIQLSRSGNAIIIDPDEWWFGSETITLKATDDSLAWVQDQAEISVEWAVSPPAATDPTIQESGNDMVLNWTEVTETAYGMPFPLGTDVLYVIWYQPLDPYAPDSDYYYLWSTADTTFTHVNVLLFPPMQESSTRSEMYYHVTVWADPSVSVRNELSALNESREPVVRKELMQRFRAEKSQ